MIVGFWIWSAEPAGLDYLSAGPEKAYYNLLVGGFQSGQLCLKTEVPHDLSRPSDPYELKGDLLFNWYDGHRLLDLSYYRGNFYLYFGVTPALVLFWPYAVLTGHYLPHEEAVLVFCAAGFLASLGLLYALWRQYFAEVNFGVVVAGAAALGLATGLPMLLSKADVYEVAISCGYAFTMLTLAAVWGALNSLKRAGWWLALASLAYGLAVGARPNLLFGAVILLVPAVVAWRRGRRVSGLLLAALGPITLVGMGLMLYNARRFGSPLEFGMRYQLGARHDVIQHFGLRYLWFNLRVYFLDPVRWSFSYPFVQESIPANFPAGGGYSEVQFAFGALTGVPLIWLGLAVPLGWQNRPAEAGLILRGLLAAAGWLGATGVAVLCFYYWVADRYEVEFLPALVLVSVLGILSLERAWMNRLRWRRLARWGWVGLLVVSVGFNVVHARERHALAHNLWGAVLESRSQTDEAIRQYREAIRLKPDYADAHFNLGGNLDTKGQWEEAADQYQEAIRLKPDYAEAHRSLGALLAKEGRDAEATRQLQEALRLKPDFAEAHNVLGIMVYQKGRLDEAIGQYREAIRLNPDYPEAHNNLGTALAQKGQIDEAISQYREALRLKPGYPKAQDSLEQLLELRNGPAGH